MENSRTISLAYALTLLVGLVVTSFGCATMDATRLYINTKDQLVKATKLNPGSPQLKEAQGELNDGKIELDAARFDAAIRKLKHSQQIIAKVEKARSAKAITEAERVAKSDNKNYDDQAPLKSSEDLEKSVALERLQKRALPKEALAKYLASKKGQTAAPVSAPVRVIPKVAPKAVARAAAPRKKVEAPKRVDHSDVKVKVTPAPEEAPELTDAEAAPSEESTNEPVTIKKENKESEIPVENKSSRIVGTAEEPATGVQKFPKPQVIVVSPEAEIRKAPPKPLPTPVAKPAPKLEVAELKPAAAPKPPAPPPAAIEKTEKEVGAKTAGIAKRRIPGTLAFFENDASVQPDMMPVLDQTSKFLLDNPSYTLLLQTQIGPREADPLFEQRFESAKAYLIGKGVPEDQIQPDSERRRGKSPEMRFFIHEH